jgi:hypothetical protein
VFEPPIGETTEEEFLNRLQRVREALEGQGPDAAVVLHSELFNRRTPAEIEELRQNAEAWDARVASIAVTLRELEAVHRDLMFDAARFPEPDFPVHTLFGDATLPFLKESCALWNRLEFLQSHTLPGMTHSAPERFPETVFNAICRAIGGSQDA